MTSWHPITAKFASEEKRILDILRDVYGLNYNQSLKMGIELLSRMIVGSEYYTKTDSKIVKKIIKISKKYKRLMDAEIKNMLKEFPKEEQEAEYEKLSGGLSSVFLQFDNIFVKNRKRGRKKIPRKRGRHSAR